MAHVPDIQGIKDTTTDQGGRTTDLFKVVCANAIRLTSFVFPWYCR